MDVTDQDKSFFSCYDSTNAVTDRPGRARKNCLFNRNKKLFETFEKYHSNLQNAGGEYKVSYATVRRVLNSYGSYDVVI